MTALLPVYPRLPVTVVGARGAWLFTQDGRSLLDCYGGHAVTPLGHGHPELTEALATAHRTLDFYSNSVVLPMQESAARAVLAGSQHLAHVHFVNSGTEANEAALHVARRKTGRETVVSFDCGFHGRTLASLSATGLPGYQARVSLGTPEHWRRTLPFGDLESLDAVIDDTVAAVLVESLPSLGGIFVPPEGYYQALVARAHAVGAMVIFDEVQGGVGRLGTWWGHDSFGVKPDMVTLAKSIGGGFPVGVLATTKAIGDWIGPGELGTTFGGGPMACAMVEATARIVHRDGLMERNTQIFARIQAGLSDAPGVQVRGRGALIGIQTPRKASAVRDALLQRDVVVGTSGQPNTVRLLPPYILSDEEIERFVTTLREVLDA